MSDQVPDGLYCWECGEEILDSEEMYPDEKRPPLDEDDCLCLKCAISHVCEVIGENHEDTERLRDLMDRWNGVDNG